MCAVDVLAMLVARVGRTIARVPVRVVVVDPQAFFCEALAAALEDDERLEVVGWTTDAVEGDRLTTTLRPDVVVCGLEFASGLPALLHRTRDVARVVVLTRGHEGDVLLSVAKTGAAGCIGHDTPLQDVSTLVADAATGRFVVDPERLGDALRRAVAGREEDLADLGRLTSREREILGLVAEGLDNGAIAKRLHLSAHTVRTHVGNVLRKLNVRSRADAVRVALRVGAREAPVSVLRIEGPTLGAP